MNLQKQRIAIAEFDGSRDDDAHPYLRHVGELPDYLNDLNAIHQAIAKLRDDEYERFLYEKRGIGWRLFPHSQNISNYYARQRITCNGTASQDSEALLRTIGKWEEGE